MSDRKRRADGTLVLEGVPASLRGVLPESRVFEELVDMEERLASQLKRRKLEVADVLKRPKKSLNRVHLLLACSVTPRASSASSRSGEHAVSPTLEVSLSTRLESGSSGQVLPCSLPTLISKALVEIQPLNIMLEWSSHGGEREGREHPLLPDQQHLQWRVPLSEESMLELQQQQQQEGEGALLLQVRAFVVVAHSPLRFQLSPELSELVLMETDTRADLTNKVWDYIRSHDLFEYFPDGESSIQLDDALGKLFEGQGEGDRVTVPELMEQLDRHLMDLGPVVVHCDCCVARNEGSASVGRTANIFMMEDAGAYVESTSALHGSLEVLNQELSRYLQRISSKRQRRIFMQRLAEDPARVLRDVLVSHIRSMQSFKEHHDRLEKEAGLFSGQWALMAARSMASASASSSSSSSSSATGGGGAK